MGFSWYVRDGSRGQALRKIPINFVGAKNKRGKSTPSKTTRALNVQVRQQNQEEEELKPGKKIEIYNKADVTRVYTICNDDVPHTSPTRTLKTTWSNISCREFESSIV